MGDIKAIETYYNGYRFRSRLEARWAVFFDALGIEYEYEPEGYEMSDGAKYLPDFYLPSMKYYAEVKGKNEHLIDDLNKASQFVLEAKTAMIILSTIPYDPGALGLFWFPIMYYEAKSGGCVYRCYAFFQEYSDENVVRIQIQDDYAAGMRHYFNYDSYRPDGRGNDWAYSKMQAISGNVLNDAEFPIVFEGYEYTKVENALIQARQARFEHGEMPMFF